MRYMVEKVAFQLYLISEVIFQFSAKSFAVKDTVRNIHEKSGFTDSHS